MRSIASKITFLCIAVCSITGILFSAINFYQNQDYLLQTKIKEREGRLSNFSSSLQGKINELQRDAKFLSTIPSVENILQFTKSRNSKSDNGIKVPLQKFDLEIIFKDMLLAKKEYTQIRLISAFNGGQELLRVERKDSQIIKVADENLQQKAKESYFSEALATPPDLVYLSPFNFNREHGKLSLPPQIVLRAAVPFVNKETHQAVGFIIVNADFTNAIKQIEQMTSAETGYAIFSDKDRLIAHSQGKKIVLHTEENSNLSNDHKTISEHIIQSSEANLEQPSTSKFETEEKIYILNKLSYHQEKPEKHITLSLAISKAGLLAKIRNDLIRNLFLLTLFVLLTLILSFFIVQKISSPIRKLMTLTQKIYNGQNPDLSQIQINTKDEIGILTQTLIDMSQDILQKNLLLESQKQAVDSAAIVAETDSQGRITYVNDKFVEISKYSRTELLGQDHRILNSGHHAKDFFVNLWQTISQGKIWHGEVKNKAKDGSFYWMDTTIYPVKDESGRIQKYIAIRFDITKRKKIEQQLVLSSQKASKAMQIKSAFLANMSHEIRTPLNSIVGLTDILGETSLNREQHKYISSLKDSCSSLINLVNDILDLSKIESGCLEMEQVEFDLSSLVDQVFETMSLKADEKQIQLIIDYDSKMPNLIYGDPLRLRQVLLNLLGNAIKFTEKGSICLEIRALKKISENIVESEIRLSDTGVGIKEENLDKIFNSFTQADSSVTRRFGGTGLGLNIVKQLVEKMNGNISVDSEFGKGSTFIVNLPLKFNSTCLIKKSNIGHLVEEKTILVVDDFEKSLLVLQKTLSSWGASVDTATSGIDALDKIHSKYTSGASYDLIILDSRMSSMGGFDVLKKLKEKNIPSQLVVMLFSSDHRSGDLRMAEELGVKSHLVKPIKNEDLKNAIRKAFASQTNGRLLVVDDDFDILESLQELLAPLNYEIELAQSTEEAISILEAKPVDTILSDYRLPGSSGIELLQHVRQSYANLPFIMISGYANQVIEQKAAQSKFTRFFKKPYDPEEIVTAVQNSVAENRERQCKNKKHPLDQAQPSLRILIAEDSEKNRQLLEIYFKNENHFIEFAENGQEAVEKLEHSQFDLVLMDMQMPIMDGYQATRTVRQKEQLTGQKSIPIVALTASALEEEKQKSLDAGCSDYLTKPIRKQTLLKAIHENFERGAA